MKFRKIIGATALATPFWFLTVYLIMSSIRPEYSHLTKAISELGSLDAPNLWYWNVLGYIIPGFAICALGVGLKCEFTSHSKVPAYALMLSGLLMTLSGIFPGDFDNRSSFTMMMQTVGSLGSFVAFLVSGFWYPKIFRSSSVWSSISWLSLSLVILSIASGFMRSGEAPGLGQRIGFAFFFAWIFVIGYFLYRNNKPTKMHNKNRHNDAKNTRVL